MVSRSIKSKYLHLGFRVRVRVCVFVLSVVRLLNASRFRLLLGGAFWNECSHSPLSTVDTLGCESTFLLSGIAHVAYGPYKGLSNKVVGDQ